jgi:hypothetical protein
MSAQSRDEREQLVKIKRFDHPRARPESRSNTPVLLGTREHDDGNVCESRGDLAGTAERIDPTVKHHQVNKWTHGAGATRRTSNASSALAAITTSQFP